MAKTRRPYEWTDEELQLLLDDTRRDDANYIGHWPEPEKHPFAIFYGMAWALAVNAILILTGLLVWRAW